MRSLDEIRRDLAAAQDELLAADAADLTEVNAIRARQESLRAEARRFATDLEDGRSAETIRRELASRRDQLRSLRNQRIDLVKQAGAGSGLALDAIPEATLNRKLLDANDAGAIEDRIGELERLLERRGQEI